MNSQKENEDIVNDFQPVILGRSHLRISLIAVFSGFIAVATAFAGGLFALNTKIDQATAAIRAEQSKQLELVRALIDTKSDKSAANEQYTAAQSDIQNAANAQRFESIEKSIDQRLALILKMVDRNQIDVIESRKK